MKKDSRFRHGEGAVDVAHGNKLRFGAMALGCLSLLWLVIRTGQKPSRIQYPCQRTALANVMISLVPLVTLLGFKLHRWKYRYLSKDAVRAFILFGVIAIFSGGIGYYGWHAYHLNQIGKYYHEQLSKGAFGKKVPMAAGAGGITFLTLPHAMAALPSPHRVVSVHDPEVTSWAFPCTSTGPCADYYGSETIVNQSIVDQMVSRGVRELTSQSNLVDAWRALLPEYQSGQIVAIKVNFNDSIGGGGNSGYADNDAYVDALPQIVNSIASGLTSIGVAEQNIWVFDVSRYITDRFRARILFPGIRYFDYTGNGSDVEAGTFSSADSTAAVDFVNSSYTGSHRIADLLVEANYLINIPIMKKHGGAGATFSLKNHMGSVNGFYTGNYAMHNYIYVYGSEYVSDSNPLVDINLNPNIRNKTILIVGDAIYGGWSDNNTPPERWRSFNNGSPKMLLFSGDPVAIDSVMYDYLERETYIDPRSEDILAVAANAGLGVHERWNNATDRAYQAIDYVEIEASSSGGNGSGSSSSGSGSSSSGGTGDDTGSGSSSSSGGSGGCFVSTLF